MSTDSQWQAWGVRDPYYAVLTNPKFRSAALTPEAKLEFLESGRRTVQYILGMCRQYIDATFSPQRVLDFGCGVGRMVIPFAAQAREVVGMDVAESMLTEARLNCESEGCRNVSLVLSDDTLSAATGKFDLVHSCLVLQHLEIPRGRALFSELVSRVQPGGCAAIQVTFGWDRHETTFGVVPQLPIIQPPKRNLFGGLKTVGASVLGRLGLIRCASAIEPAPVTERSDPEMQMNYYNLSELMFILQRSGIKRVFTEFSNHGGALGVFMFFQAM